MHIGFERSACIIFNLLSSFFMNVVLKISKCVSKQNKTMIKIGDVKLNLSCFVVRFFFLYFMRLPLVCQRLSQLFFVFVFLALCFSREQSFCYFMLAKKKRSWRVVKCHNLFLLFHSDFSLFLLLLPFTFWHEWRETLITYIYFDHYRKEFAPEGDT